MGQVSLAEQSLVARVVWEKDTLPLVSSEEDTAYPRLLIKIQIKRREDSHVYMVKTCLLKGYIWCL